MSDLPTQLLALGALANVLFALAAGTLACGSWLGNVETGSHTPLSRLQWGSIMLLALAHGGYLWLQTMAMGDVSFVAAGQLLWPVLTESHYGKAWLLSSAGLAVVFITMLQPLRTLGG